MAFRTITKLREELYKIENVFAKFPDQRIMTFAKPFDLPVNILGGIFQADFFHVP